MSETVKQALGVWVQSLRGALQWHAETGEADLPVPADFAMPPLGEIAPQRAEPVARVVEAPVEAPSPSWTPDTAENEAPVAAPAAPPVQPHVDGPLVPTVVWGNPWAATVFVVEAGGEAPPADSQFPLGGEAGALLMRMIKAMKLGWRQVFLVACVRQGEALRAREMRPAVDRALALAPRRMIVSMGVTATRAVYETDLPMPRLRGKRFERPDGVAVRPTFTPDALVQNPKLKADAWNDLQGVMRELR